MSAYLHWLTGAPGAMETAKMLVNPLRAEMFKEKTNTLHLVVFFLTFRCQIQVVESQPWDWIGLHLFNDDTRPSGHISRPFNLESANSMFIWQSISWLVMAWRLKEPGSPFNIKMSSYQYGKSHCGNKTVIRSPYLHNGISYTGKTIFVLNRGPGHHQAWYSPNLNGIFHCQQ